MKIFQFLFLFFFISFGSACRVDTIDKHYRTKHVIVIVVDGARYSETWGESTRQYIPFRNQRLLPQGIMLTNFTNEGNTWTSSGHDAICTSFSEPLDNGGNAFPTHPSYFQYWREATGLIDTKAWIVTSKDKLYVLSNTADVNYQTKFMPRYDCGINGPFTGYREDSITFHHAQQKLELFHPDLMLINFREPDYSGHQGNWTNYVAGIFSTDKYIDSLWTYLQTDPYYAGTTTLIITNDHGRHLPGHLDGFQSHGDSCMGCRHVEFIASGPDFKRNVTSDVHYDLRDIPKTIAELMNFPMPSGEGRVMREIFK